MKENIYTNDDEDILNFMKIDELETKNNDPQKYKLQCMLPDYVFNKLTPTEQKEFEQEVVNFPDLEEEVKEAKTLFDSIEKIDYKKIVYDKSQYLPDRVVENLQRRNALHTNWKPRWKRLIAVGVFAAAVILYINFGLKDKSVLNQLEQNIITTEFFSDSEKEMIADIQDINLEDIPETYYLADVLFNNDANMQVLDDYYTSTINNAFIEIIQTNGSISFCTSNDYMFLLESIDEMDESYFQELLNYITNF